MRGLTLTSHRGNADRPDATAMTIWLRFSDSTRYLRRAILPAFARGHPSVRSQRIPHFMRKLFLSLLAILPAFAHCAVVAPLQFGPDGVDIDAGSLGKFTLSYPGLLDAQQHPVHKFSAKRVAGNAAELLYEDGAQMQLTLGENGRISVQFSQPLPDVKFMEWNMLIPIAFNQGGRWMIGDKSGDFPKVKPPTPHLYQDHAPALLIQNYEGKTLEIQTPEYSFLQLTDNREWNWPIFNWRSTTPFDASRKEAAFVIAVKEPAGGAKPKPLVDQFGQSEREDWPQKVKSLAELMADVEAEKTYYDSLRPPALDPFGGLPGSREKFGLQATGFFHVEKQGARWLLVDPAGNAFFHLGLCGACPSDDYTLVKGREASYAWLPPREGEFSGAYQKESGGSVVSFHLANMIRKYGQPFDLERYTARMIERMKKWGFNSIGAFSYVGEQAQRAAQFPRVAHLPLDPWNGIARLPSVNETFDPFDPATRTQIEENCAKLLPAQAADPLIIGYFIVNEPIYENVPHMLPTFDGTHACKREFVRWLERKYKTPEAFGAAWDLKTGGFPELIDRVLSVKSDAAKKDVQDFTGVFFEEYFRLVSEAFRRHDKNHLLIGCRLQPGTINNEQLCRIAGKYLDVMSFNYYTDGVDKDFLRRIDGWTGGRPMILSEFFWGASRESGLTGGLEVPTQQQRGLAYRNYVEQSAALGFVVGIEWFTMVDQSVCPADGSRVSTASAPIPACSRSRTVRGARCSMKW